MSDSFKNLSELLLRLDQRYAAKGTVPSGTSSGGASPVTPHSLADNFLHSATGLTVGYVIRAIAAGSYAWAQLQHADLGGVGASDHHASFTPSDHTAIGNSSPHHAPVTLDANADTLLSLSTQALGLDTQAANTVLAGPTTGGAVVPAFRALVAADIPSHKTSHAHGGSDALVVISATEPASPFAGMLWVDNS